MLALLHPVAQLSPTQFSVHPSTAIGIAAFAVAYVWRIRQGPSEADLYPVTVDPADATPAQRLAAESFSGPTPPQRMAFFTALALLFVTLNGPLHDLSDFYLFSAHMVQHLILTLVVPPLMIVGTPGWMLRPLLRRPALFRLARRHTSVVACFVWFNVVLALWHLPPMYNLALAYHPVHILQHLMFIAASVLMWWPLLSPLPELPRAPYPAQMLYCFLMVIPMSIISIYIAMADTLLYPAYAVAPRIMGITPMEDQQYGGLIMWIPGGVFFYAVMTVIFFKWSSRGEDDEASAQVGWVPSANNG
ncbi:cytochrome c oxidase assembly protein [Gemmatimonas aurantiaca]|uniref:cytochrome c oxidase assembly protein n=1 Tax=Gemmatimonas aurantiaca TaxID=173480 RepID=UPI00301CA3BF